MAHVSDKLYRSVVGVPLIQIFAAGVLVTGRAILDVSGMYYHVVQMTARDGSDIMKVRGSSDGGVTYFDLNAPLNAIGADGNYQFIGIWDRLEFTKTSGTGVATNLWYRGQAS